MKNKPTDTNPRHSDDDAPADERDEVFAEKANHVDVPPPDFDNFLVAAESTTAALLGPHPRDSEAVNFVAGLRAIRLARTERLREGKAGKNARRLLRTVEAALEATKKYLEDSMPMSTREEQVEALHDVIARGDEKRVSAVAQEFVDWLYSCDRVTCDLPSYETGAKACEAVERALVRKWGENTDPEKLTRAALRELGYPENKAKNLFFHRDQKKL